MGGHGNGTTFSRPVVKGRTFSTLFMAAAVFFLEYRIYNDGAHHFLHHHAWSEPKVIHYLEQVDAKYGTRLAKDNMDHH